ncbi:hypothetical protein GQR58_028979 [Nymphon striatum]|nr:hypothetical protein GQR58_028979 [Nymphon striatum]
MKIPATGPLPTKPSHYRPPPCQMREGRCTHSKPGLTTNATKATPNTTRKTSICSTSVRKAALNPPQAEYPSPSTATIRIAVVPLPARTALKINPTTSRLAKTSDSSRTPAPITTALGRQCPTRQRTPQQKPRRGAGQQAGNQNGPEEGNQNSGLHAGSPFGGCLAPALDDRGQSRHASGLSLPQS